MKTSLIVDGIEYVRKDMANRPDCADGDGSGYGFGSGSGGGYG